MSTSVDGATSARARPISEYRSAMLRTEVRRRPRLKTSPSLRRIRGRISSSVRISFPLKLTAPTRNCGPLHDAHAERQLVALEVRNDLLRFHARLDVPVVGVEVDDPLGVLLEDLPRDLGERQDPEEPLLGEERVLDLLGRDRLVALDDDPVDVHLLAFDHADDHPEIALGRPLGARGELDAEEPLLLVAEADRVDRPLHLDRVVEDAHADGGPLAQLFGLEIVVPLEPDLPDQGPLGHDEDEPDAALELLGAHLDVVEEAQGEDGPDVLADRAG